MMNTPASIPASRSDDPVLDDSGKTVFDDIYVAPDPRAYCATMQALDYVIPENAQPIFSDLFRRYRKRFDAQNMKVLDLGSSYGINAALLRLGMELDDLFDRYTSSEAKSMSLSELLRRDRKSFADNGHDWLDIVGLDISEPALDYAVDAGLVENAVRADLENNDLSRQQADLLRGTDCVVSTGCIGYVTTLTLEKIIDACAPRMPWMGHCVLRMFPLDDLLTLLRDHGYHVDVSDEPIRQRRFASTDEREQVLSRLRELDIDARGYEDQGWLYSSVVVATHDRRPG